MTKFLQIIFLLLITVSLASCGVKGKLKTPAQIEAAEAKKAAKAEKEEKEKADEMPEEGQK